MYIIIILYAYNHILDSYLFRRQGPEGLGYYRDPAAAAAGGGGAEEGDGGGGGEEGAAGAAGAKSRFERERARLEREIQDLERADIGAAPTQSIYIYIYI